MNTEEFVRKDIFDAEMSRLESEINSLHKRIDDTRDSLNRTITIIGLTVGLFAVLLAGLQIAIAFSPVILSAVK